MPYTKDGLVGLAHASKLAG